MVKMCWFCIKNGKIEKLGALGIWVFLFMIKKALLFKILCLECVQYCRFKSKRTQMKNRFVGGLEKPILYYYDT